MKRKQSSENPSKNSSVILILMFCFESESCTLQIIDRDKMQILIEKNFNVTYSNEEKESNKIINESQNEINNILQSRNIKIVWYISW